VHSETGVGLVAIGAGWCGLGWAALPAYVSNNVQPSSFDVRYTHFYSISPDACTNPTIYWLGR
jgi:hypothetical protein